MRPLCRSAATSAIGNPQTVALSGAGVVIVTVSPTSVNFGSVGVGAPGIPQTIHATNTSGAPLSIGQLTFSGGDAADFTDQYLRNFARRRRDVFHHSRFQACRGIRGVGRFEHCG